MTLQFEEVCASTGGRDLFLPVSRSLPGTLPLCLWGPSGRGKTSLLRILSGFSDRYRGRVLWDGIDIRGLSPMNRARIRHKHLRLHLQSQNLFPELTVLETVLMGCREPEMRKEWIEDQCRMVGIKPNQPVGTLSWGERHRAALVRTLADRPELVFIDEPFSSLDPETAEVLGHWLGSVSGSEKIQLILTAHEEKLPFPADFVHLESANVQ